MLKQIVYGDFKEFVRKKPARLGLSQILAIHYDYYNVGNTFFMYF